MLIHYIIVRRDLPLGVLAAQVTHAAGHSVEKWRQFGNFERFKDVTAVVLGVEDEAALEKVAESFWKQGLDFEEIYESSGLYKNQFMAIGLFPGEEEALRPKMTQFELLS